MFSDLLSMTPTRIAEIITIVGVILLVLYVFQRLNLFKKD